MTNNKEQCLKVKLNDRFPTFQLKNQNGELVTNDNFRDKWLVVYFYPKDDTRGCTIQVKEFTEKKSLFDNKEIAIIGVSQDSVSSHQDFHAKFKATIDILSDEKNELINQVGIPELTWEGVPYWGRTTFLIDGVGYIKKIYEDVTPEGHAEKILADIAELKILEK